MTLSGGIMGLMRTIEVNDSGQATVSDQRASKTVGLQLTPDQMASLQTLVAQASYTAPNMPVGCVDCFVYKVEISRGNGKPLVAQMDDTSIDASGMGPLAKYLAGLMDTALK